MRPDKTRDRSERNRSGGIDATTTSTPAHDRICGLMRYLPDDGELLGAIAALLEDEVMPRLSSDLQHKVRVAVNLSRTLQRQQAYETCALDTEQRLLAELLGEEGNLPHLRAALDRRIRGADPSLNEADVWQVLVATARGDLTVAKPGYDSWDRE